jgi:glycosyltransferase involved in cell wall biosynthesis
MKIACVVCAYPPYAGGIGNSAQQINNLLGENHHISVFTPTTTKPWLRYGHGAFMPQLLWKLKRFDYIYLHYPFFGANEIVWLFKLISPKTKLIIHYHMDVKHSNWLTSLLSAPSKLILGSLLNRSEIIVSASLDYIKSSQIKNYYQKHSSKFREIPFAVNTKKLQPKLINRLTKNEILTRTQKIVHYVNDKFIKKNIVNLVFIGGLDEAHYFKGIDILLEALFLSTCQNWRLKIIGDGNRRSVYEEKAKNLLFNNKIEFTGKLSDAELTRSLQNADLLILPSINSNEAFGIVLIEALACGVPVLASDLPGVRKVFTEGVQGLLAKPNNANDLKNKLEFILSNEPVRRQMAIAARQLAEEKYNLELMKARLENLLKS